MSRLCPLFIAIVGFLPLVAHQAAAQRRFEAEAIVGQPFGVGRVTVPLTAEDAAVQLANGFRLTERHDRAHYPVFTIGLLQRLVGAAVGQDAVASSGSLTVLFVFTGREPLDLVVHTARAHALTVVPRAERPRIADRLRRTWWRQYNAAARQQIAAGDYPPLVETYLTGMLGRRLNLPPPLLERLRGEDETSQVQQTLQLLMGTESLRTATLRRVTLGQLPSEPADQPLPADMPRLPLQLNPSPAAAEIEPIAMHVPEECFYVRFGTFANYLWLSHLLEQFGGDISRMVTRRGFDAGLNARLQQQIALKQTTIGELLGGQLIADVAMIGRDLYLREGAAFGMLFQAKNGLLGSDFRRQRQEVLKQHRQQGATLRTVQIAGHDVSLLSTPDNRLRSFYAVDGDFHLVTTCQHIVERFFEAGQGRAALGASPEFQHARQLMPNSRQDTIFLYLSTAFFRGLISPQYQIELARRMRAVAEMEAVQIARQAARGEGLHAETIDELIAAELLPPGFGQRPDGSRPLGGPDGRMVDSLRGRRGTFTPVPDVPITGVTQSEAARYRQQAAYYQQHWRQLDPIMIAVRRYVVDGQGRERVAIDANVAPLAEEKYGWLLSLLGPPTTVQITPAPGDVVTAQMSLKGGLLYPDIPVHHLFGGIQDVAPPAMDLRPTGFFKTLQILRTAPAYVGAWPQLGFLDLLPLGLASPPDAAGFSRWPLGLWRRQVDGFSVLSFDPNLLAHVTAHLRPVEAPRPAQIRLRVADLSQSRLTNWINALSYQRAVQTTLGNIRLLHSLTQQLGTPPDAALQTAEQLLDVKLICSLGGQYELKQQDTLPPLWQTTALAGLPPEQVPADYQSPLLDWFRGLELDLTKTAGRLSAHALVDLQLKPQSSVLPSWLEQLARPKAEKIPGKRQLGPEVIPTPPPERAGPREF